MMTTTAPHPTTTTHSNVGCDICKVCPIVGVRFKCGNCIDYDLCSNCIGRRKSFHDPSHVFLYLDDYWGHNATDPPLLRQLLYNPPGIGGGGGGGSVIAVGTPPPATTTTTNPTAVLPANWTTSVRDLPVPTNYNTTATSNSNNTSARRDLPIISALRLENEFGFVMEEQPTTTTTLGNKRISISLLDFIKDKTNEVSDWERSIISSATDHRHIQSRFVKTTENFLHFSRPTTHPTCFTPTDNAALTKFVQDKYEIQDPSMMISTSFSTLTIYEPASTAAQQRMQELQARRQGTTTTTTTPKPSIATCMTGKSPTGFFLVVGYSPDCQGGEAYIPHMSLDPTKKETILASSSTDGTSWQWYCINAKQEQLLFKPLISGYRILFETPVFK